MKEKKMVTRRSSKKSRAGRSGSRKISVKKGATIESIAKSVKKRAGKKASSKAAAASVFVVNMIPKSLSGEENQDSEPTIAVNPANPLQIAASAFTPDPAEGPRAPIYVSADGGQTWTLNSIVPSTVADGSATADITVAFGSSSNVLYAGIIRFPFPGDRTRLNILRTKNFQSAAIMDVLVDRIGQGVDQPYLQAATAASGPDKGKDRVYVGDNDFNAAGGKTATIDQTLSGGSTHPSFKSVRIESRVTSGQDGPPVRPAIHPDGTVYAVFHSWRAFNGNTGEGKADIVVVRDDNGGAGQNPFRDLVDPDDHKAGVRIVQGAKFNFNGFLGQQRTGGDVSIAVDPTNKNVVYVAYNDDLEGFYVLHVRKSVDGGQTWSPDLRTVRDALNPALAVNSAGKLGLLYQQLTGTGAKTWVTKFLLSSGTNSERVFVLHQAPANRPIKQFDPYLGDYDHLMAVGKDFYGIFSGSNSPRKENFPCGIVYERNVSWNTNTLLDVDNATTVNPSIDPFFFKVKGG
jgi:hypothetical protein